MEPVTPQNVYLVAGALASLVVFGGLVVGIVMGVLRVAEWLRGQFGAVNTAISDVREAIASRFAAHESEERVWQADLNAKVEDMRERLARMEGQLSASAEERRRRSERET